MRYAPLLLGGIMESYMVRVYRRQKDNPETLIGIARKVGDEGKRVFSNLEELWSILNPRGKDPADPPQDDKKRSTITKRKKNTNPKRHPNGRGF